MKTLISGALVFAIFLFPNILSAQLQLSDTDLAAIESTTLLSAGQMPPIATFYSAADPSFPAMPGNIFGLSGWQIGAGYYLLNDLNGNGSGFGFQAMDDSGRRSESGMMAEEAV
jgi:hypothetical protein